MLHGNGFLTFSNEVSTYLLLNIHINDCTSKLFCDINVNGILSQYIPFTLTSGYNL